MKQKVAPLLDGSRHGKASHRITSLAPANTRLMMANIARKYCGFALVWLNEPGISGEIEPSARQPTAAANIISGQVRGNYLGHVDKWRSQRRIEVMSMKPRKLSAVLS